MDDIRNVTPIERQAEGKLVNATRLNRVVDRVNASRGPLVSGTRDDEPRRPVGLWAKVTADSGSSPYKHAWTEREAKSDGTWRDRPDGLSGTTSAFPVVAPDGSKLSTGKTYWVVPTYAADDGSMQYRVAGGGGGVDLQVTGTSVVSGASAINIPAASAGALTFTASGSTGNLGYPNGTTAWQVVTWNGTAWVVDFVRAHA